LHDVGQRTFRLEVLGAQLGHALARLGADAVIEQGDGHRASFLSGLLAVSSARSARRISLRRMRVTIGSVTWSARSAMSRISDSSKVWGWWGNRRTSRRARTPPGAPYPAPPPPAGAWPRRATPPPRR